MQEVDDRRYHVIREFLLYDVACIKKSIRRRELLMQGMLLGSDFASQLVQEILALLDFDFEEGKGSSESETPAPVKDSNAEAQKQRELYRRFVNPNATDDEIEIVGV